MASPAFTGFTAPTLGFLDDVYERSHGRLRPASRRAVDNFLACGILDHGIARCRAEFLLACCKTRLLCPSCHAKRLEIWSD